MIRTEWMQHSVVKTLRRTVSAFMWIGTFLSVIYAYTRYDAWDAENKKEWADKNCPGLLSITRSARDTLNLMRAVDDCNTYVLRTLE
jgi:hypothetical protein